jgi:hypothetical protein
MKHMNELYWKRMEKEVQLVNAKEMEVAAQKQT